MKELTLLIFVLLLFSSCRKEEPIMLPEYNYIKGEWVAYRTEIFTSDAHGGYIHHYKNVEDFDKRAFFLDDCYLCSIENIVTEYDISNIAVENSYDTNLVTFYTDVPLGFYFKYYINEDSLIIGGYISAFFPEFLYSSIEGGNTYYRRVQ